MPTNDTIGRSVPTSTESPDIPRGLRDYSLSNPGIIDVTSRAAANQLRTDYVAACQSRGILPRRLHVWRTDIDNLERDTGSGWEYVAGLQHGAKIEWSRSGVPESPSTPLVLYGDSFTKSSPGWTFSSAQNLVIPQTGAYNISFSANASGSASTMGRSFFQFSTTNGAFGPRFPATNEDNWGGSITWDLAAGNQLRVQVFHTGGGSRTWSGTMVIAMVNSPNW